MNGTLFGIGPMELLLVAVLVLLVFGPERLPGLMRDLGRSMRSLRKYYVAFSTELQREMEPYKEDIKGIQDAAKGVQEDLNAIRQAADIRSIMTAQDLTPAKLQATPTIAPPAAAAVATATTAVPAAAAPSTSVPLPAPAAQPVGTPQVAYAPPAPHNGAGVELSDDNPWAQSAYTPRSDKLDDDNPWGS
ncbi:MAG TPA: twin-arginine translocase TatA/TatE family subunit [Anaerolineae bacterium]